MSFLSRVLRESVSVHRNIGRVGVNLLQGDLSGAAAARREAGRTVVHGIKRDLLGDDGSSSPTPAPSNQTGQVMGGVNYIGGTPGFYEGGRNQGPAVDGGFGRGVNYIGGTPGFYDQQRQNFSQMMQSLAQLQEQWKGCSQGLH